MPIFPSLEGIDSLLDTADYTFTAQNANSINNVTESLTTWKDRIRFKTLDLEQDTSVQDLKDSRFDVVIASMVGFASNSSITLERMKKMLKPDGKLCLIEVANSELRASMMKNGWSHSRYTQYNSLRRLI